ncbi:MAG: hypothetical protein LBC60_05600 [Spirochaetaceae bacterium]|nr:hypothetical protein [Spirochaetaceae bacterium]
MVDDGEGDNASYYLMGYLPSAGTKDNNFLTNDKTTGEKFTQEKDTLLAEEGMVLRYQQTGKITPSAEDAADRYSEIGFYHRDTQWEASETSQYHDFAAGESDDDYSKRLWHQALPIKENDESSQAHIKRLTTYHDKWTAPEEGETFEAYVARLTQAGFPAKQRGETFEAYKTRVKGYHDRWVERKTKEIPKIDQLNIHSSGDIHESAMNHHRTEAKRFELLVDCKDEGAADPSQYESEHPFGDRPGDDSNLYAGDAHIRAKNRIIIKAGDEIRLQVGRSSVIINDDGITITSRKANSNVMNSWDTVLSLSPRSGISMFGTHVSIGAAYTFALSEAAGGSIGSMAGVLRINAKDIKAFAYGTLAYAAKNAGTAAIAVNNIAAMTAGLAGGDTELSVGNKLPSLTALAPGIVAQLLSANYGLMSTNDKNSDPIGSMVVFAGLVLEILKVVYTVLDLEIPKQDKNVGHGGGRDGLNLAATVVEYGVVLKVVYGIGKTLFSNPMDSSLLHLTHESKWVLSGDEGKLFGKEIDEANSPTISLDVGTITGKFDKWYKIAGAITAAIVLVGGIGTGVYFVSKADAKALEELKEL